MCISISAKQGEAAFKMIFICIFILWAKHASLVYVLVLKILIAPDRSFHVLLFAHQLGIKHNVLGRFVLPQPSLLQLYLFLDNSNLPSPGQLALVVLRYSSCGKGCVLYCKCKMFLTLDSSFLFLHCTYVHMCTSSKLHKQKQKGVELERFLTLCANMLLFHKCKTKQKYAKC